MTYHNHQYTVPSSLRNYDCVDLMMMYRTLHEANRRDPVMISPSFAMRFSSMTWSEIIADERVRFRNLFTTQREERIRTGNSSSNYVPTGYTSRSLRAYFRCLEKKFPHLVPGRQWVNWRLVLEHGDYRNRLRRADKAKVHDLRQELSRNARGWLSQFTDGSSIHFVARTYDTRWTNDLRLVFTGETARTLLRELDMPARCQNCAKSAHMCQCVWADENGSRYWRAPLPPVREGQSALGMQSHSISMLGKEGLAVGVELELHTVPRKDVAQLAEFCVDNLITRKPDGSSGVAVELCTPPMRQEIATNVLTRLHELLRNNGAQASLGCGMHVHVDGTGLDRLAVSRLLTLWKNYGPQVWDAMPDVRHSSDYCRNTTHYDHEVEYYGNVLTTGIDRAGLDRYVDLNLQNLRSYSKTVEFRLFPAYSDNPDGYDYNDTDFDVPLITEEQMLACVAVSREFVRAAITNDTDELENAIVNLERTF
jgi:hypothetical protein